MRERFGVYLLALMAALTGVMVPASAHATTYGFIMYDVADSYCLTAFLNHVGTGFPTVATSPGCDSTNPTQTWTFYGGAQLCVFGTHCGPADTIRPDADHSYCLSQNNAGAAYLTKCTDCDPGSGLCTGNDYQTWIFYYTGGHTYLLDYGSNDGGNTTIWCLSSNKTAPPGIPAGYGAVYTTAFNTNAYHQWN